MTRKTERLPLPCPGSGTEQYLTFYRYGNPGARPKAYIQGALHADEVPGLLVQHHLARLLDQAAANQEILGEIVLAPYANPIGLSQFVNGHHMGRYDLGGRGNFNRNWPDLLAAVAAKMEGKLGGEAQDNVAIVRAALGATVAEQETTNVLAALRKNILLKAIDADLVFDLHCDDESLLYLYTLPNHWPGAKDLAVDLDCDIVILADPSGGTPFDETFSSIWTRLTERFPSHPIPLACLSVTVELRGQADVSDRLAAADAAGLYRVLQRRGLIAGDPGPLPEVEPEVSHLEAVDNIKMPATGVVCYNAELGDRVRTGDVIAEIVDPAATDPSAARLQVLSATDGLLFSRRLHKYQLAGSGIAKIAGSKLLPHRQGAYLMED